MNEVIERVARAIAGSAAAAFGDRAIHYVENNWGAYTNQARAAIAVLREPTDQMVTALMHSLPRDAERADYREALQAAIGAAVKEE